jgi:hypothetical protein
MRYFRRRSGVRRSISRTGRPYARDLAARAVSDRRGSLRMQIERKSNANRTQIERRSGAPLIGSSRAVRRPSFVGANESRDVMRSSNFSSLVQRVLRCAVFSVAAQVTACGSAGNDPEPAATTAPEISAPPQLHAASRSNKDIGSRLSAEQRPVGEFIHFPQPPPIPPLEHPGLRANKAVKKPEANTESERPKTSLPAVSLEVQRKQAAYLAAWEKQRASLADMAADARERSRAALKQKLLGE